MDTPGPYEMVAKRSVFHNITLPETSWSQERRDEFMRGEHRGTILSTAIHEAYPGHYVQFQWLHQAPTRVRKLIAVSNTIRRRAGRKLAASR